MLLTLENVGRKFDLLAQAFDADAVAGKKHLLHGVMLCLETRRKGKKLGDNPEIDLLCWVAGEKQINKAMGEVGIKPGCPAVIVAVGDRAKRVEDGLSEIMSKCGLRAASEVIEMNQKKIPKIKKAFEITDAELAVPIEKIVLERIAMLELNL